MLTRPSAAAWSIASWRSSSSMPRSHAWRRPSWPSRRWRSAWASRCSTSSSRWAWMPPTSSPPRPWPATRCARTPRKASTPSSPSANRRSKGADNGVPPPRRVAMLIDSHVHLDASEFAADRDEVIGNARAAGVQGFVVPAVGRQSFDAVLALAAARRDVGSALGIHPMYVMGACEDDLDVLEAHLARGAARAVGEIGLDHFVTDVDPVRQLDFFVAQLKLARRHDLPVILHVRRAVDPILKQLRRIGVRGGIAHAFNGSRQQAQMFIDLGF